MLVSARAERPEKYDGRLLLSLDGCGNDLKPEVLELRLNGCLSATEVGRGESTFLWVLKTVRGPNDRL